MKAILVALLVCGAPLVLAPAAEADPGCVRIYNHVDAGPVDVYQYSSCDYEVCVGDRCTRLA